MFFSSILLNLCCIENSWAILELLELVATSLYNEITLNQDLLEKMQFFCATNEHLFAGLCIAENPVLIGAKKLRK